MVNDVTDIPLAAIAAINQGRKIEAIKIVRVETSVGLKEAKEIVERYIDTHPEVEDKFKSSFGADKLRILIAVICVVVIGYFLLK